MNECSISLCMLAESHATRRICSMLCYLDISKSIRTYMTKAVNAI